MNLASSPVTLPSSNLEYALYYSGLGWGVFPAHTIRDGRCSCGNQSCRSPGKHPMTRAGLKNATTDRHTIIEWWNKKPDANIAIRTGKESNLVALDIDTKSNGFDSLKVLENTYSKLPNTLTSVTGGNGKHICFVHPGFKIKTCSNILSGIDFRGDGGYIIAPHSLHISGNSYDWVNLSLNPVDMPEWLIKLVNGEDESELDSISNIIPEGQRNTELASIAGKKWRQGTSKKRLHIFLSEENQIRCKPPLDPDEISKIVNSICRYQPGEPNFKYSWLKQVLESNLPAPSKHLLLTLAYHMDSSGRSCYPTQRQLELETSMVIKTIRKHTTISIEAGYLKKYQHNSPTQKFWNYGYYATIPD